jgi:hypothetical protein
MACQRGDAGARGEAIHTKNCSGFAQATVGRQAQVGALPAATAAIHPAMQGGIFANRPPAVAAATAAPAATAIKAEPAAWPQFPNAAAERAH